MSWTAVCGSNGQVLKPHVVAMLSLIGDFFCLVALLLGERCCASSIDRHEVGLNANLF